VQTKRVAFVVGHEHWGKSWTLRALEEICDSRGRRVTIDGFEFLVRKMSNDDKPESYLNFVNSVSRPNIIAALCPKFKKLANYDDARKAAGGVLQALQGRSYQLFFWVIGHKWGNPADVVSQDEISQMRNYGTMEIFTTVNQEASERAREFRTFISSVVCPKTGAGRFSLEFQELFLVQAASLESLLEAMGLRASGRRKSLEPS